MMFVYATNFCGKGARVNAALEDAVGVEDIR